MNKKYIVVINGAPTSGKDTFVDFVSEYAPTRHISSVSKSKEAAMLLGWNGEKTEDSRKALYEIKEISDKYFDTSYKYMSDEVSDFLESDCDFLFIDIREPEKIKRFVNDFSAITLFINKDIFKVLSNDADRRVCDYDYDYIIYNETTLDELREKAKVFVTYLGR